MKKAIILFVILAGFVLGQDMIVRVYAPSWEALKKISAKYELDIAGASAGEWYDIVADKDMLNKIIASGFAYEVTVHSIAALKDEVRASYLSYDQITDSLQQMAANYPSICKFDSLPITTYEGRWIYGIKISDNPDIEEDDEPGFLIDGQHHAREWACHVTILFFADSILSSYGVVSEITDIINTTEIYCFPVINVDGFVYDYPAQLSWRKNREPFGGSIGTDPNRNYPGCAPDIEGDWGAVDEGQASHRPSGTTFCGAYANSGDETRALTLYAKSHTINAYMTYHSHGELLMWPWGWTGDPAPDDALHASVGNTMADMIDCLGSGTYDRGPIYSAIYPVSGSSLDWFYSWCHWVEGISNLSYTIELGTTFYQPQGDLDEMAHENFDALLYLADFCDSIVILSEGVVPPPEIYPIDTVFTDFTVYWHAKNTDDNHPTQWELVELSDPSTIEDDLESGTGRWLLDGFTLSTTRAHSGTYSYFSGNTNNMNHAVRTVHPYLVQSGDSVTFWCWYDLEDDYDVAVVEVSENTKEWFNLDTTRFTGNQSSWTRKAYSLEDWVGKSVYIRFRSMTDGGTLGDGFYVDDISPVCLFANVGTISSSITDTSYYFTDHPVGDFYHYVKGYNTTLGWGDYSCLEFVTVIVPPTGPYLTLGSLIVNDAGGNGQANPGELIDLGIWVKNIGIDTAYEVYGLLSESDAYASLGIDSSWYGDIPEDDSSLSSPYYSFNVANDCPNNHTISFTLELHDGDDSIWTSYPSVTVYAPILSFVNVSVVNDDNGDGILDAGETADLVVTIENEGGANAENVTSTLLTASPYITINDDSGDFGSIDVDATADNASDPYNVSTAGSTPIGTLVQFEIEVVSGVYVDTLAFSIVVGKEHYYLWNPDPTPASGEKMDSILADLGYSGDYGTSLAADLTLYQSVLVCVGIYPNNYVIGSGSAEAVALVDFVENQGGRMYLEGGDVWYWDPSQAGGYDFGPLFGINATADGHADLGPVVGESGEFTEGMNFTYGGENMWIDNIVPTGTGFLVFHDGNDSYGCGVANDPGTYRTVGTSFELGLLVDDTPPSTRSVLLDRMIQWLGSGAAPDVTPPVISDVAALKVTPSGLLITWNPSETDTLGYPETMSHYVVYRDTLPDFIPGPLDSIGMVVHPDTEYVDSGALLGVQSYYYLVKAVDAAGNRSKKSNMVYALRKTVNEDPVATDKNWVSLPYVCEYDTVSDLTDDLSPSGDPLVKVTNLRDDQLYESWSYTTVPIPRWTGTNYVIEAGCAYEMVTTVDDTVVLVGCNEPDGLIFLNENAGLTDKNLVSIPYNAVYGFVEDITDEYASSGDPLVKVTNLRDDQLYESWSYTTIPTPRWTGTNFGIEAGRGYEFVTIVDTVWNPTEYSNEASGFLAARRVPQPGGELYVGTLVEPDRAPVWSVREKSGAVLQLQPKKKVDYLNAQSYVAIEQNEKQKVDHREVGISHVVRGYCALDGFEHLVFTVYRPDRPYDVLTENMVGSGILTTDDCGLFWFDVGNFMTPWHDKEEVMVIIEASRDGKGYFTVLHFTLDSGVDIQELGELSLVSIPEPKIQKGMVSWDSIDNENIVGYSLYENEKRLNEKVITTKEYAAIDGAHLKTVIKGGHETVYGAQGSQGGEAELKPISFAFTITPTLCVKQARIEYAVPDKTPVEIVIYDVSGRQIKTLVSDVLTPGYYFTGWNGTDYKGRQVASGIYFVKFTAGYYSATEKLLLIR